MGHLALVEKKKRLTTPSVGKDVEQVALLYTASESVKWKSHFERVVASDKFKYTLSLQPQFFPRFLPKRDEYICPQVDKNVHSICIH